MSWAVPNSCCRSDPAHGFLCNFLCRVFSTSSGTWAQAAHRKCCISSCTRACVSELCCSGHWELNVCTADWHHCGHDRHIRADHCQLCSFGRWVRGVCQLTCVIVVISRPNDMHCSSARGVRQLTCVIMVISLLNDMHCFRVHLSSTA